MQTVTAIRRASRAGSSPRVAVDLDGEEWLSGPEQLVAEFLLRSGLQIDAERRVEIEARCAELDALVYCHRAISQSELTERQLRDRLVGREYPPAVIEYCLARTQELGLVDDRRYAESFIRSRIERGHGRRRIRHDLTRKGVDGSLVDGVFEELADPAALADRCQQVLARRFRDVDLSQPRERARAQRFLARRGYSFDEITAALASMRTPI